MVLLNLSGGHPKENYIEHFLFLCGPYFIIRCDIQYNIVTDCTIPTIYINPFQPLLVSGSFFFEGIASLEPVETHNFWTKTLDVFCYYFHWCHVDSYDFDLFLLINRYSPNIDHYILVFAQIVHLPISNRS